MRDSFVFVRLFWSFLAARWKWAALWSHVQCTCRRCRPPPGRGPPPRSGQPGRGCHADESNLLKVSTQQKQEKQSNFHLFLLRCAQDYRIEKVPFFLEKIIGLH